MSFVRSLRLHNFRCYESASMAAIEGGLIVLCGPNGAGKTNILEAVSLLTPGRGLRGAGLADLTRRVFDVFAAAAIVGHGYEANAPAQAPSQAAGWAIAADVDTGGGVEVQLGTGLAAPGDNKRSVRINGVNAKGQIALADYLSCVWLTPQMDRLFLDGVSGRRRFFDKLIFAFDPAHGGRVTRYENAMASRSKLLREGRADPSWLAGLEAQMAETGVAIAAARLDFLERLQMACAMAHEREEHWFPKAQLTLAGTLEELLAKTPAVEVEEMFLYQLGQSRRRDADTGGAATGPHKTDFLVRYAAKDMPAAQCSTGEQKALLIGLILAHARLMKAERGAPPVLLLDEVAAHLDESRRAALFDLLSDLGAQVWMTGTDESLFEAARTRAQFWRVHDAKIEALAA